MLLDTSCDHSKAGTTFECSQNMLFVVFPTVINFSHLHKICVVSVNDNLSHRKRTALVNTVRTDWVGISLSSY